MNTFVFEVEETRVERWYITAKDESEAREKLFISGEIDETFSHSSSVGNVTLMEIEDE